MVLGVGVLLAPALGAESIYVGASAGECDATSIQEAIDLAGATAADDEIRLTRTQTYGAVALEILEWDSALTGDLVLSGGWDDCSDAAPDGRTTLVGNGTSRVLVTVGAAGTAEPLAVTLRALEISGGSSGVSSYGETQLLVEDSRIHGNTNGGLASAGARIEIDPASVIEENTGGSLGGGLACLGAGSRLVIAGAVQNNAVSGSGGGIFAFEDCAVELRAGATIEHNSASRGGGLVLAQGSRVTGGGAGTAPVRVAHNIALEYGGGILFSGPAPQSLLGNVRIESNSAPAGAGVFLEGAVVFQLERFNFEPCADPVRCTTLSGNRTTSASGFGSAAFAGDGAQFRMMQGYIEENGGDGEASLVLVAGGTGSIVLDGVQIRGNDTESIFHAVGGAEIVAGFVTAAGNRYWDETAENFVDSRGASAHDGGSIGIYTSILTDHGPFETLLGGSIVGDCLMVDTAEGIAATVTMVGVDPRFRDPAAGDLHLRPDSPAIDSCDTSVYAPLDLDFDLDPRGFDSPTRPNVLGPFDRGADESPLLFANGFESGNTGAWSASVP